MRRLTSVRRSGSLAGWSARSISSHLTCRTRTPALCDQQAINPSQRLRVTTDAEGRRDSALQGIVNVVQRAIGTTQTENVLPAPIKSDAIEMWRQTWQRRPEQDSSF